jgi:hypothetical protein
VRHAVAVVLLLPAASCQLLAALLAVRRAASIAAYYSNVLVVTLIPGMHYLFVPELHSCLALLPPPHWKGLGALLLEVSIPPQ